MLGPQTTSRKKKRFCIRLIAGLAIVVIAAVVALDYRCAQVFPGIPYRWHIKLYLKDVVWRWMIVNSLTNALFTREENLSTTKLPVWEIQLSGRKLAALNHDLPLSGWNYQSGTLLIDSSPFPARFRFRGGGFWHWMSKQKSWKIQLRGNRRYEGKREFNLINPRTTITLLMWPLSSYVAQSMGLKTPTLQYVHARLNGRYLGVYCLVENIDHDFTAHHDLPEGALYEDEVLGSFPFFPSWERIDDWEIRPPGSKTLHQAGYAPGEKYEKHLSDFLQCINIQEDEAFFRRLEELIDINQYLKWWAHATLFLDSHQDSVHNNKLYLDPTSAKLQQIPWDLTINFERNPDDGIDLNMNPLTERLLQSQSPRYVHLRNKIIWDALQGPADSNKLIQWFDNAAGLIRPDIYSDPYKDAMFFTFPLFMILSKKYVISAVNLPVTNEMFENDVVSLRTFLRERMAYLEQILSTTDAKLTFYSPSAEDVSLPGSYSPVGMLGIEVGGEAGVMVEEIRVHGTSPRLSQSPLVLFYGGADKVVKIKGEHVQCSSLDERTVYTFTVNELLLPGRVQQPPFGSTPVRFTFTLAWASSGEELPAILKVEVKGMHPFTHRPISLESSGVELSAVRSSLPRGTFLPKAQPSREIIWSGVKKVDQDVRIGKDEILIVRPGTRIELSQGASLLSYGRIVARGTSAAPIVFTKSSQAPSWGVVALQGSGAHGSVFDHCIFEYGSDDELEEVFYSGALSIYNADATITHCLFRFSQGDDALNTKFSHTDVTHSTFIDNTADGYDLDFSDGLVVQNVFERNGNDGIDCGTAHPTIRNSRIFYCGDKGISIGERSHPVVEGNIIAHCNMGIAVKDQSQPVIRNNEFLSNVIAVSAYQKKKVFGGAHATIHESKFYNNQRVSEADEVSSVSLVECEIVSDSFKNNGSGF